MRSASCFIVFCVDLAAYGKCSCLTAFIKNEILLVGMHLQCRAVAIFFCCLGFTNRYLIFHVM